MDRRTLPGAMPDDDEVGQPSSDPPPRREGPAIISLRVPRWATVTWLLGLLLSIRLVTATDYVAMGRLELMSVVGAALLGVVIALRYVTKRLPDEPPLAPRPNVGVRFALVFALVLLGATPPAYGFSSLANRIGMTSEADAITVRCTTTRLESRVSLRGGRRPTVHYACVMPDGQRLNGHAPEELPAEPGKGLVIPSVRGRLGVWLRVGPPVPIADPTPPLPLPAPPL